MADRAGLGLLGLLLAGVTGVVMLVAASVVICQAGQPPAFEHPATQATAR